MDPSPRIHSRFVVVPVCEDREKSAGVPKKRPIKLYALLISLVLLVLVLIATLVVGVLVISSCEGKRVGTSGLPTANAPQEENRHISSELWSRDESGKASPSPPSTVVPPLKFGDTTIFNDNDGNDAVGILVIQP